jgi:hypothetical protein
MKPMQITLLGQVCVQNSWLDPFAKVTNWTLPNDFHKQQLTIAITDPWLFGSSPHDDFLQAIQNLHDLCESISFPAFCHAEDIEASLDIDQLSNNLIVLRLPFFKTSVRFACNTPFTVHLLPRMLI